MRTALFSGLIAAALVLQAGPASAEISWQNDLKAAHAQAEAQGKLLLLHFYTDNCVWCERLEKGSFLDPTVNETIASRFVPVRVNAGQNPQLTQMFQVKKFPTDVVVTVGGQTLSHSVSPQDPARYVAMLAKVPTISTQAIAAAQPNPGVPSYAQPGAAAAPAPTAPQVAPNTMAQMPIQVPAPNASLRSNPMTNQGAPTGAASNQFVLPGSTPQRTATLAGAKMDSDAGMKVAPPTTESIPDPELAMQGFCPVTVIAEDRWVEGNPQHGVIHLGKLYLFDSAEKMKTFLADPVPYTPVLNEIDVVRFFEERKIVKGKREFGLKDPTYNRMFFFADEAAMNHFWNEYERYSGAAIEVMEKAVKDSNPGA